MPKTKNNANYYLFKLLIHLEGPLCNVGLRDGKVALLLDKQETRKLVDEVYKFLEK